MKEIEFDATVWEPEAAMQALVDAVSQLDKPGHVCAEYNGIMMFAGPDDLATPDIVKRLTWSLRITLHRSWLLRARSAVTDLVLEIEIYEAYLRRRLAAPNVNDPDIGLRLLVDLAPTLYCPWGRIAIRDVYQAFLQHQAYDGWRRVPFTPDASNRMLVQRAMRLFSDGKLPPEEWLRHARSSLKLS